MALTVRDIVSIPGMPLRLLAGEEASMRPVRWVHSSELEDPTAWLKGGELILTTGMGVGETAAKQRAYVRRLVDAGVAGLGFGLGFGQPSIQRRALTSLPAGGPSDHSRIFVVRNEKTMRVRRIDRRIARMTKTETAPGRPTRLLASRVLPDALRRRT